MVIAKAFDWLLGNRVYFYPLLLPMALYYALEMLYMLLVMAQVASIVVVLGAGFAFCAGIWLGIMDRATADRLLDRQAARLLVPFVWGCALVIWLAEEVNEDGDAIQPEHGSSVGDSRQADGSVEAD